jgi:hypothetical protein
VGAELFHANGGVDGRTDRQTDMTNLIVAFRTFTNAPKYTWDKGRWFCVMLHKIPTVKNKKTLTLHVRKCRLVAICANFDIPLNKMYFSIATSFLVECTRKASPTVHCTMYLMRQHYTYLPYE